MTVPNKRTTEWLRYEFSDQELLDIARRSAQAQTRRLELLNRKLEVMKDFGAKIAAEETVLQKYGEAINQGYEYRATECGVFYDRPELGLCELVRLDTGEVVSERRMEPEERQHALDFKGDAAPAQGPEA